MLKRKTEENVHSDYLVWRLYGTCQSFVGWCEPYRSHCTKGILLCEKHGSFITDHHTMLQNSCPICEKEGYYPLKDGFLYCLNSTCKKYVKIGITKNMAGRLKILKKSTPFDFEVFSVYRNKDYSKVRRLEKYFHKKFKSCNFKNFDGATEWLVYEDELVNEFLHLK